MSMFTTFEKIMIFIWGLGIVLLLFWLVIIIGANERILHSQKSKTITDTITIVK